MPEGTLDVAIVGAGHNGLVAAAYLARAGLRVAAFERRDLPGGACVTEELWPGVRASPAAYTLSLLRKEIMADLDLAGHGLRVDVHDPYLFAPLPDGRRVVIVVRLAAHPRRSSSGTGRGPTPTPISTGRNGASGPPCAPGR